MTKSQKAALILEQHQAWRLGGEGDPTNPQALTSAINHAIEALQSMQWRFLAYDSANFENDLDTPYQTLMKPAMLKKFDFDNHGRLTAYFAFDDGRESSQFAENIRPLQPAPQGDE